MNRIRRKRVMSEAQQPITGLLSSELPRLAVAPIVCVCVWCRSVTEL